MEKTLSPSASRVSLERLSSFIASHHRSCLAAIILLYIALALCYVVNAPPVEGPDESGHLLYTHHILDHGTLPPLLTRDALQSRTEPTDTWNTHTHHPPLYYLLSAAVTSWTQRSDIDQYFVPNVTLFERTHTPGNINLWLQPVNPSGDTHVFIITLRLMSVIIGALTLLLTYTGALIASHDRLLSLLTAAVPLAIPSFLLASASVGNDILLIFFVTAGIVWSLHHWQTPTYTRRDYLLVTVILTLAILTKLSGITLIIVIYSAVIISAWQREQSWQPVMTFILVTGGITALLVSSWFLRLWAITGHPLGTPVVQELWGRTDPLTVSQFIADINQIWRTLWVSFGYSMHPVQLPDSYYLFTAVWTIIGGIAGVWWTHSQRQIGWLFGIIALVIAFLLYGNLQIQMAYGRLLLPALLPFALVVTLGWWRLHRGIAMMTIAVLLVVSALVTTIIVPRSYQDVQPVASVPDSAVRLSASDATDAALAQSIGIQWQDVPSLFPLYETIAVDVYLPGALPKNAIMTMSLVDSQNGETITYMETVPGMVNWATAPDDQYYRTRVHIPLPPDASIQASSPQIRLQMSVLNFSTEEILGTRHLQR